jgi:hypothetical protein
MADGVVPDATWISIFAKMAFLTTSLEDALIAGLNFTHGAVAGTTNPEF